MLRFPCPNFPATGTGSKRIVLLDPPTEQIAKGPGCRCGLQGIVFVFHGGALAKNQMAALANIVDQILRGLHRTAH